MKNEIIQRLNAVYAALNKVTICGHENQRNMAGSLDVLSETIQILSACEIEQPQQSD